MSEVDTLRAAAELLSTHSAAFIDCGETTLGIEYQKYADAAWWAVGRIEAQEIYEHQES